MPSLFFKEVTMAVAKKSPEPKTKIDMVKPEALPSIITVQLIGTPNELIHEHTLFYKGSNIVFVNGKAEVSSAIVEDLRTLGVVK